MVPDRPNTKRSTLLPEEQTSRIRSKAEELFARETNGLKLEIFDKLLAMQSERPAQLRLQASQMKDIAIRYCGIVRRANGVLAAGLAEALAWRGDPESCNEKSSATKKWILSLTARFTKEKTSRQKIAEFCHDAISRNFTVRNAPYALRVLRESISLLATTRKHSANETGELNESAARRRSLKHFALGDPRGIRKLRHLFLKGYNIQSAAQEALKDAETRFGFRRGRKRKSGRPDELLKPRLSLEEYIAFKSLSRVVAAQALGLTVRTIHHLVKTGKLNKTPIGRIVCDEKFENQYERRHGPLQKQ